MKNQNFNYSPALIDKLTLLLPLKGRLLFTLRYFLYMEAVKCPFKILIADGSLDDENKKIIDENKHRFSSVNFEYHRFPPDNTVPDFYKKMADALAMVKTPYVMWNSNDDFYVIDAMFKCLEFLEDDKNQEYVACGGTAYKYQLLNKKLKILTKIKYPTANISFEQPSAYGRILAQIPYKGAEVAYSITRTYAFSEAFNPNLSLMQTSISSSEYLYVRGLLLLGKIKQLSESVLHIWQASNPQSSSFVYAADFKEEEWEKGNRFIANKIAEKECLDNEVVYQKMLSQFKQHRYDLFSILMDFDWRWLLKIKRFIEKVVFISIPQNFLERLFFTKYQNNKDIIAFLNAFKTLEF